MAKWIFLLFGAYLGFIGLACAPTHNDAGGEAQQGKGGAGTSDALETGPAAAEAERIEAEVKRLLREFGACGYSGEGPQDCEVFLEQAIALDPERVEAHEYLASYYRGANRPVKAAETCKRMQETLPNEAETYLCLAEYLLEEKPPEEIRAYVRKAVELEPGNGETRRRMGLSLLFKNLEGALVESEIDEAIRQFTTAQQVAPLQDFSRRSWAGRDFDFAAMLATKFGRYEEGAELIDLILDTVVEKRPGAGCELLTHYNVKIFIEQEVYARLQKIRRRCSEIAALASRLTDQRKTEEAISKWEEAKEDNPYELGVYRNLPKLYVNTNQREKARAVIEEYFDLEHDPRERCDMKAAMFQRHYEEIAPELLARVKKECEAPRN